MQASQQEESHQQPPRPGGGRGGEALLMDSSVPATATSETTTTTNNNKSKTAVTTTTVAIPLYQRMVLAAFSGMGAATICHPLDVIRVNMQTASQISTSSSAVGTTAGTAAAAATGNNAGGVVVIKYKNSFDAGLQIYRQSGLQRGLYAGLSAAYLRQWLYGSCRIGIYSYLLEQAQINNQQAGRPIHDIAFSTKLMMGCISGGIGS